MPSLAPPSFPLWRFRCQDCGEQFPFGPQIRGCPACRERNACGLLELERQGADPAPLPARSGRGLVRYLDLLPILEPGSWRSLGEGGTALVRSTRIGPSLGFENLWFKLEQQNPTGSFKDRFVAVTVNLARAFGYRRVAVSSTGNLGLSTAAYCAAIGLECLVIVPSGTPQNMIAEANLYGARIAVLDKEIRLRALDLVAQRDDWFALGLFMNRPVQNPFGVEGYRTFAYEMIEAMDDVPAAMLFPCARGNALYGTWKGYAEAQRWRWCDTRPRMVACQPAGANSLEVSLQRGSTTAIELPPADSIARSTSETLGSDKALSAIRESSGTALSATDAEIIAAVGALGQEGLNVEASSALPVACLPKLRASLRLKAGDKVVCVLTATGRRWPDQAKRRSPLRVEAGSLEEFARVLD